MKNLQRLPFTSAEQLDNVAQQDIKGGRRYVTKSYSAFARKRNELQNKRACMCITHVGNTYCIEW